MKSSGREFDPKFEDDGPGREAYWRRKLRRFRFGAEPIGEQLARQFRVTIALTAIPGGIGLMFLAIFGAFGRVDVGMVVVGVLVVPVVAFAWIDYAVSRARTSAYLEERAAREKTATPPG